LDTAIEKKEMEKAKLIADITKNPTIKSYSTQLMNKTTESSIINQTTGKPDIIKTSIPIPLTTSTNSSNPKIALIPSLDTTIMHLRSQKSEKENALLVIRPKLEEEIGSKVGFLDELQVMYALITGSGVALSIWLIWFFFLLGIEMLVLISKMNEKENDYEKTVKHHMDLQMKKLELFAKMSEHNG